MQAAIQRSTFLAMSPRKKAHVAFTSAVMLLLVSGLATTSPLIGFWIASDG